MNTGNKDVTELTEFHDKLKFAFLAGDHAEVRTLLGHLDLDSGPEPETLMLATSAAFAAGMQTVADTVLHTLLLRHPDSKHAAICHQLAYALSDRREYTAACTLLRCWLEDNAADAEGWNSLGGNRYLLGDMQSAKTAFERALSADARFVDARYNLATVHASTGDFTSASREFKEAFKDQPANAAVINMALNTRFEANDSRIEKLESLGSEGTAEIQCARLFALGKAYDDIGEFERAFENFREGNRKKRSLVNHDPEAVLETAIQVQGNLDAAWLERYTASGKKNENPVFIIGLPRSGSSLVERILGKHSDITACGETFQFQSAMADFAARFEVSSADEYAGLLGTHLEQIGERYLERMRQYGVETSTLIDKTLHNFWHVGIIANCFPGARFVHCIRNPIDLCFGCYRQLFDTGETWAYDFQDIARYHGLYVRLMEHWHAALPNRIYDLVHEDLLNDPQAEIQKLLEYCELPSESACFNNTGEGGSVRTLSSSQVRSPINRLGLGKWRNYETHLSPLLHALEIAETSSE